MENAYTSEETKIITQEYKELLKISYQTLTEEDKKLIRKAFEVAVDGHKYQRRKSGEPYILHPIAVAKIVAHKIGLDAVSIASALLHDVVEDTEYTIEDIKEMFGDTIAKIVKGLTKISNISRDTDVSLQAENFRKMLLTLNDDVRVILIKIADRLHNMQTMDSMPDYKQQKIASETLFIYAPLAHRVGLYNIKTELEDLGLKYTDPEMYNLILGKIEESKEEQTQYIKEFTAIIRQALNDEKIDCYIKGRPKSIYSIYKKMVSKAISYDKFAIRVVYKSDEHNEKFLAWKIYSVVTDHFRPNPTRLRDWLSTPKSTGYEALHTTVMGPKNRWVEIQIRSERMHEIAEKGYAAHFKYKHGDQKEQGIEVWLNRLQEVLENSEGNAVEFVQEFKMNLYADEIFIFTPNGEIKSLPKGSTPLDFAFYIHTEVGMHTRGAKVNNKLVPLNYRLKSGDQVEIITAENALPNSNWLDYATTAKALSKIKSALRESKKKVAEEGKEALRRKLKQLKLTLSEDVINDLVTFFKAKTSLDIFYQMGTGEISNQMLKDFVASRNTSIFNFFRKKTTTYVPETSKDDAKYDMIVFGKDEQALDYTFSKCCTPIPGDDIFGYIAINGGSIKVHKKTCPNAVSMHSNYAYRIIPAKWVQSTEREFDATIKITGIDRKGLVAEITNRIQQNTNVTITNLNFNTSGGVFEGKLTISITNTQVLHQLLENLYKINGVDKITRI